MIHGSTYRPATLWPSMRSPFRYGLPAIAVWVACCLLAPQVSPGQVAMVTSMQGNQEEVRRDGPWEIRRDEMNGGSVMRRVLTLAPKRQARPALSIQLIPNEYHRKEGNAAIFYFQAMGFFERSAALQAKLNFERTNMEEGFRQGKEVPPFLWLEMEPNQLPVNEVTDYLVYTSFQPRYLSEAVQRKDFSADRRIKEVGDFIGTLLPEIQSMRDLARQQSLRFRLAIAQDRTDDAVAILGQQLALGSHLGQDHFLVSALVGMACVGIGMSDALYLCEHADAPNLYWAMAALPKPLVDLRHSLTYEREVLFLQFPKLLEVDETPKSDGYWKEFAAEYSETLTQLTAGDDIENMVFDKESGTTLLIALGVPGARRYLREVVGLTDETLAKLSNTQIYFLAVRRYWEIARDEVYKIYYAPERQQKVLLEAELMVTDQAEHGLITVPTGILLPAVEAAFVAARRCQQQLALMQTIESIRHHLATHDNAFPKDLEALELPAPIDPVSDKPFAYELHSEGATLKGAAVPGVRYEIELRAPK
jgi:hypothetical protein